jgi:hypothetical protein
VTAITPPGDESDGEDPWAEYGADIPLHAGTARVWPDLLYVEYFSSRADLVNRGNAGRLLREALARNPDPAATSGLVFKEVPSWAKEFSGLEAHERDHVRRLLATSYGLLCHAFRAQQLTAARDLVAEAARLPDGLKLPLSLSPQAVASGTAAPAQRALIADRLRLALEHHISIAEFRAAEPALAGWTAGGCAYVAAELPGDPSRSALAITNAGNRAKWLTARHLLELFGCCEQGNRLLGTGSGIDEVVRLVADSERMYTLPMLMWFSQFPTPRDRPRSTEPHTRSRELYLGFYRGFPLELFVAADLALWPPFTPDGLVTGSAEIDWTDINPAFRFARILMAYKRLKVEPGEWPPGDLNQIIPALQHRVCEMLGWPTPGELAARWHDHLSAGHNTWFADAAVGGFRHTTTLQLLALRRDRPGDVVVNNVDYNAIGVSRSPGWLTREPGSGLTPHTLAAATDREATEFWLGVYAMLPALLGTTPTRIDFLRSCSADMRQACIAAFDIWGNAAADWPSDKFRQTASEFLNLRVSTEKT